MVEYKPIGNNKSCKNTCQPRDIKMYSDEMGRNIEKYVNTNKQTVNNMKQTMTKEQFNDILVAFQTSKNDALIHMGVCLVASNNLHLDYLSDIPEYMKTSLCRKVLRYVAQTALKGTMEIDGLASSCSFCAMENGHAVSFGSNTEWTFYSHRAHRTIKVEIYYDENLAKFYDLDGKLWMKVELWQGCHWTQSTGRIDLISHFDDTRNPLL